MMNVIPSPSEIDVLLQGSLQGDALRARYKDLTSFIARTNEKIAPLKEKLAKVAAEAEKHRAAAAELAKEIEDARGGSRWLTIKKEAGILANLISGQK